MSYLVVKSDTLTITGILASPACPPFFKPTNAYEYSRNILFFKTQKNF